MSETRTLTPDSLAGDVVAEDADPPLPEGTWYTAETHEDALVYEIEAGALADAEWLALNFLLDGEHLAKWELRLHEAGEDTTIAVEDGPTFGLRYSALNHCQGRARIPLEATDQNRWKYDREGAWLKPLAGKDRVNLDAVDRISIAVIRKSDEPVRWCQTPLRITDEEPDRLDDPLLPEGPLADEFGQSTIHTWDGHTDSEGELCDRLQAQADAASAGEHTLPEDFSTWGGWADGPDFEATGFFDTHHDGDRWWLVDPDGNPFWSTGLDCVQPSIASVYGDIEGALAWLPDEDGPFEAVHGGTRGQPLVNYLGANFGRAFGADWHGQWADIALSQLRRLGFNTVGNWSEWEIAREAGVPYVRPLRLEFPGTETIYRDFPDVYADGFRESAEEFAQPLAETKDDPALIGYFLGNEPTWAFADETPAAGMLYTTDSCATRTELRSFLEARYDDDAALADAWEMAVTFADIESGRWDEHLTDAARTDLADFSEVMVEEFYRVVSEACRAVDSNHLNLGTRYPYIPGDWAIPGMRHVDVFSANCYEQQVPTDQYRAVSEQLEVPVLVGEWHFGALDAGLPASGICRVTDQQARGDAYRGFLEDAAAKPWCVGTHYFTMYDQSIVGRFDGENYNIGFFDVCHRPYPIAAAARESHERLYDIATGEAEPFDDLPELLSTVH